MLSTLYLKIIGAIVLIGIVLWSVHTYNGHQQALGAARERTEYQKGYQAAQAAAELKERADRDMWGQQSKSYEETINALRHPVVPVPEHHLVCHSTPTPSRAVPADPAAASGPGQADPPQLGATNEFDPGPALDAYALDVQEMAIQCTKIQEGYLKLSGQLKGASTD
jgi:hypothetical protein